MPIVLLEKYQRQAKQYLIKRGTDGSALFLDMRLGKTFITVSYLTRLTTCKRILVLGPYSVLSSWIETLLLFNVKQENIHCWYGTGKERKQRFLETIDQSGWILLNKESHRSFAISPFGWDAVIVDESITIANPKSKYTQWCIRGLGQIPTRIILNGTPAPKGEFQYFSQLQFQNKNILPYRSFWDWRAKRFRNTFLHDWEITPAGKKELTEALAKHCYMLKREDVGIDHKMIYIRRDYALSTPERKLYNSIEKDCLKELEVLKFAGQRWVECRKIINGQGKLKLLKQVIENELNNRPCVIWCCYLQTIQMIAAAFKGCAIINGTVNQIDREKIKKNFKAGKYSQLLVQPNTMKFGSKIEGASAAIFYDSPDITTRLQAEPRITQYYGKDNSTLIIDLVAKDTIDEDILISNRQQETEAAQLRSIVNGIKRRLGNS